MAKRLTLFLFLLFSINAFSQLFRQGFEGAVTDNWNFTPTPARYNVPPPGEDYWTDTTATTQIAPFADAKFWLMQDLDNPNGGFNGFHTLDFQTIDLAGLNAGLVGFAYWTTEYEAADSIGYILHFDNGTTWDRANYVDLNRNTGSWQLVQFPIPPGSTHVRLRLMAKQNGGSDWAGFDAVQIEEGLPPAVIGFDKKTSLVKENAGMASVQLNIANAGFFESGVRVSVVAASTAAAGADYVFSDSVFTFEPSVGDPLQVQISLPDDAVEDGGKYLILRLSDFANADAGANLEHILLIADDEVLPPARQGSPFVELRHLGSFAGSPNGGSAEISAYDPASKRLFNTNITNNTLDILDLKNPVAAAYLSSIDMAPYGGGINSVAVKNGIVAASVQGDSTAENGSVVFFSAADGAFLSQVTVGNLPDMITFNNDGTQVLTANEGEPASDYSIDPLGSVSVIDLSPGVANLTNANVTTLTFESFDAEIENLRAAGVRIFGVNATVGKDLEPEYVCVSPDNKSALVTLQENNAIAKIDLENLQVIGIQPLGYKDLSLPGNSLDASDQAPGIFFANWNARGMYHPDAVECFVAGGTTYAITANEGDSREYSALTEGARLGSTSLDPVAFPDANYLKNSALLGRLNVTKATGDTDGDGDLDEIYVPGGRSFSIWNVATGALVWDSGNDLETIIASNPAWGAFFNASNGTTPALKNRSDDKGPEPEGVTVADIEGRIFAFVCLERIGGVVVYEVTDPAAPEFVQYINTRQAGGGDLGPESLIFIPKNESPNGRNLLVLSNEVSGTVAVFQVELDRTNGGDFSLQTFDYQPTDTIAQVNGVPIFEGGISGLHFIPGTDREFFAVSDRGPNADAGSHPNATGTTLLFLNPDYAPKITRFKAENGGWSVQSVEPVRRPDGSPVTGLPLPVGAGNTGEVAWADTTPTVLANDAWGLDLEGVVEDNHGNLWTVDEYGASVWKLNKATQKVVKRYTPHPTQPEDAPLPAVIGKRRANRGFEGVAVTPNGKVYAFLQSVADNPNSTAGNAGRLIRLVEIDPETDAVRQFAYEIQPATGQIRTRDWKIGDLVAVNNTEFLLVEHAERNGWNVKNIYKINIANASPLTTEDYAGMTLEQVGTAAGIAAFGVQVIEKTLLLDLLEAGWDRSHDKPEGLTILDNQTIAVVNDNDFGIASPAADGSIELTGKATRLYIYGLPQPLGYVSPYCSFNFPQATVSTCAGTSATLDAGAGFAAYSWSDGSATQTIFPTAAGTYRVTVTNADGCKSTDSVTVTVNSLPVVELGNPPSVCEGENFTFDAGAGFAGYSWNDGSTSQILTASASGVISVTVTDANGCAGSDATGLIVNPLPQSELGEPVSICENEFPLTLDGSDFIGGSTYAWSGGETTPTISVNSPGNYAVTVTNVFGCTLSDAVQVGSLPVPGVNLGADQAICPGNFATLDAGAGFANYAWSNGSAGQTIQASAAGNYAVTITGSNGCTNADALSLTVFPTPNVDLGADQTICEGETATLLAGAGFANYAWSTGATSQNIAVGATGTYSVVVTDANGCTDIDAATVFVNPAPVVNLGNDTTIFLPVGSHVLDAGAGFASYFWSDGSTAQTLTVTETGTVGVTVTDGNGCEGSDEITVSILPSGTNEPGLAGELKLFPNPASGWLNLQFGQFETGVYEVSVLDLTGRAVLTESVEIQGAAQTARLDLSALASGNYFVKVAGKERVMVRKVVVE